MGEARQPGWPGGVAVGIAATTAVTVVVTLVVAATGGQLRDVDDVVWIVGGAIFAGTGAVIVRGHPRHRVGWAFVWIGLCGAVGSAATAYATLGLERPLPWAELAAWAATWVWAPSLGLVVVAIAVFPTGRPVNRFFAAVAVLGALGAGLIAVVNAVALWPLRSVSLMLPQAEAGIDSVATTVLTAVFPVVLVTAVVALCGLVLRFRRATGAERQQLKWIAVAALVMVPTILAGQFLPEGPAAQASDALSAPAWFAVAAGVAVLRYRLYDVDRILSRTLAYAVVTAVLVAVYAGSVVSLGSLARGVTGESGDLVVAVSTLLVAALFQPVRQGVQGAVDRRFNRGRVDGLRAVEDFARRLRDEVDLTAVVQDLRGTVRGALEPATVTVVALGRAETS